MSDPLTPTPSTPDDVPITPAPPAAAPAAPVQPKTDLVALQARVLNGLRERHELRGQSAALIFGAGLVAILVIGFVVSFLLVIVSRLFFDDPVSFGAWFGLYTLIAIGVTVWQERRTRHGFFTFAAVDVDLRRDPENSAEYLIHRSQTHFRTFVEVLLWGPRALIAGAKGLLGKPQPGLERVLPEAAETLTLLLSLDGGVKLTTLVGPDEDPMQLMPVLKWLDTHDYIGISSRGDRVWVSSPARKRFLTA